VLHYAASVTSQCSMRRALAYCMLVVAIVSLANALSPSLPSSTDSIPKVDTEWPSQNKRLAVNPSRRENVGCRVVGQAEVVVIDIDTLIKLTMR